MEYPSIPPENEWIPLYRRDGAVISYTRVSAEDIEFVNRWRWGVSNYGYAYRSVRMGDKMRRIFLHRALLGLAYGDERQGDHINRDRLDNRRSNLRIVFRGTNQQNRPSYRGSSSQYRGVSWHKHRRQWIAAVEFRGERTHLGYFDDEAEAGRVAREARLRLLPYAVD